MGENEKMDELLNLTRKQELWGKITAISVCVIAVVILISALLLVPRTIKTLNNVDVAIETAEDSLVQLDEMSKELSEVSVTMNEFMGTNSQAIADSIESLNKIDIDTLNAAISGLRDAVEPFAKFVNMFSR